MSKREDCKITVDKACGLSVIPEVDQTPIPCEEGDFISTKCVIEDDKLISLGLPKGSSQHEINLALNNTILLLKQRIRQLEIQISNIEVGLNIVYVTDLPTDTTNIDIFTFYVITDDGTSNGTKEETYVYNGIEFVQLINDYIIE